MRYARMLTNAVLGGSLLAAYLTVLVLQLNPHHSLHPSQLAPLALTLWLYYGVNAAVVFYALIVLRQLLSTDGLSPGWLSLRILAWLSAASATGTAVLMWINLRDLRLALDPDAARRMAIGATATTLSALALLAIAVVHYSYHRRGSRVGGALFALAVGASLVLPLVARGEGVARPLGAYRLDVGAWVAAVDPSPRVTLVLLDGASLDFVSPAAAEGRLPNFGRILDAGAAMHLATLQPTQPAPVWASVATGKYPAKHGVPSASTYQVPADSASVELLPGGCFAYGLVRLGFLGEVAHTSTTLRARPLWSILSGLGLSVGIVGWPLTHPAPPVNGYLVSDRLRSLTAMLLAPDAELTYPRDVLGLAQRAALRVNLDAAGAPIDLAGGEGFEASTDVTLTPRDALYAQISHLLERQVDPRVVAVRYQGLDEIGHRFLRYAMPRAFGDVSEDERRRYGMVLERYYAVIDAELGRLMATLGPDDLLLVVSGFGMQPVGVGTRVVSRLLGDPDRSGTHEHAPDGFMLAYGQRVAAGRLPRGAIVDVAPTVLYFLGLPVGRDFDGYARTDVFTRAFTAAHPITYIPTYER